jgi:drug/metabolite transporter (DMT)-like permease
LIAERLHSRQGAYAALVVLTLIWGSNWLVLKFALQHAHPIVLTVQRTWLAVVVLFAVLILQRRPLLPESWIAIAVTGFFQTTINFGSTTMALAGGGAGRTSVLVFTMPFWTLLLAWPVLHERVKRSQWYAVGFAFAGLAFVVEPWNWAGDIGPKLWAVLSGFGWAAGSVATKYFQRERQFDSLNFLAWQILAGVIPLTLLPMAFAFPATSWSATYVAQLAYIGVASTALGFMLWIAILRVLPAGTASLNMFAIPVIALLSSMVVFDERLTANEWTGIVCIGVGLAIVSFNTWRASRRGEAELPVPTPLDGG